MADKKGPTPDDIMGPGEMKPLLTKSKQEPVNCAIGLTEDKLGVVLLHKKTRPKKLLAELKAQAKKLKLGLDAGSLRFGTAEVDPEIDAALVRFRINKGAPGTLEPKLREHIKKSGFTKVEIVVDETLEEEPEDDEAEAQEGAQVAPPPPPPPPPGRPQQQQQQPDWGALGTTLSGLAQQIATVASGNPMLQQPLVKLAVAAQTGVKTQQDFTAATAAVEELRRGLAAATEQARLTGQAQAGGGAVTYAKSRLAWLAVRKKVESDIEKLRSEIIATYKDDGIAPDLDKAYQARVGPVLEALDERLADKLDDAMNQADPAKRAALVAEAKEIMGDYTTFLNTDKTIAELDANPFVPLSIQSLIAGTLNTLAKAVH